MIPEIVESFDTKTALTGLYLWLLFGFLSSMVGCDFQKWMVSSNIFRHFIGIISFFFLFTIFSTTGNVKGSMDIWKQTIFVYILFLFMVKNKWYYLLPVLILLVIDQSIKVQLTYETQNSNETNVKKYNEIRNNISTLIIVIVIVGFVDYTLRQKKEFGDKFSFTKLLFTSTCKK